MLYALLFLPALLAIALVVLRKPRVRVLAAEAPVPPTISGEVDALAVLDAVLADLESSTLEGRSAEDLDELARAVEQALERVG
jgi:hypothetical protein